MRLWRLDYCCPDGHGVIWGTPKRSVERAFRKLRDSDAAHLSEGEMPMSLSLLRAVTVPTNRKGLVDWLNGNLSMDNG